MASRIVGVLVLLLLDLRLLTHGFLSSCSIVGRALDSYAKNPTISGQVRDPSTIRRDLNMTDLVVFSDNRALQTWLGHQQVTVKQATTANVATTEPIATVAVGASMDKGSALPRDRRSLVCVR